MLFWLEVLMFLGSPTFFFEVYEILISVAEAKPEIRFSFIFCQTFSRLPVKL